MKSVTEMKLYFNLQQYYLLMKMVPLCSKAQKTMKKLDESYSKTYIDCFAS